MSIRSFIAGGLLLVLSLYLALNVFSVLVLILSILLAMVGLSVTLGIVRYVLDKPNAQVLKYHYFGPIPVKIKRYELTHARGLQLELFSESQVMNNLSQSTTARAKSFDVRLLLSDSSIVIYESTEYQKSLNKLKEIGEYLELSTDDKYARIREAAFARRKNK